MTSPAQDVAQALSLQREPRSRHRPTRGVLPVSQPGAGDPCVIEQLGQLSYKQAWDIQLGLVERRKLDECEDRLLLVEHPHTITLGRNAHQENILAPAARLSQLGIECCETDRGGDVTYHGPGQLVGYPILHLARWKRDVAAYMRALEEVLIRTLAEYGIDGDRDDSATGVWVNGSKVAALGIHISRWVTSHGLALNISTDLDYFGYIIPCGLARPVTSLDRLLGVAPDRDEVSEHVMRHFGQVFERRMERQ